MMREDRKTKSGMAKLFKKYNAKPRCLSYPASYITEEKEALAILKRRVQNANLTLARSDNHGQNFIPKNSGQRRRASSNNASTSETFSKPFKNRSQRRKQS